ncbi:MAG TPA: 16S rRNA (adenine(1518)-N(6)/adenine(1519)-N(6))-dimethyltransferase RsmA [Candidatus Thermoplasmatota archaeon]|nr:16S rRNA (adenine(1518)-N(6)/adenine(1519)-N(6))-dimethyltransferase RsmA [Candidatus Thermoplasmatota archaeon]
MNDRPKKSLGQHFLTDARVAERAVRHADVGPDDVVLEIGPGRGILTRALAAKARRVVAVELDRDLADVLAGEAIPNVEIVKGDALEVDLPKVDKIVANLPYQISSPVTFRLLDHPGWSVAVLMYQREFAERLVAKPATDAYGRLSVHATYRARCEIVERVPPGVFFPPPKVESALVRVRPRAEPAFPVADEGLFLRLVAAAFTQRRKTLASGLRHASHLLEVDEAALKPLLADLPHREARPETLAPETFGAVADWLHARLPGGAS